MYTFRKAICPKCEHLFMHQKYSLYSGERWAVYIDEETNTFLDYAVCPRCTYGMVLYEQQLKGIDPSDNKIKKATACGI